MKATLLEIAVVRSGCMSIPARSAIPTPKPRKPQGVKCGKHCRSPEEKQLHRNIVNGTRADGYYAGNSPSEVLPRSFATNRVQTCPGFAAPSSASKGK
jgi:hypothetical protein